MQHHLFTTRGNDNISAWHLKDLTARNLRFDNRLLERCVFQNVDFVDVMSFSSWKMQHCRLEHCRVTGEMFRSSVEHSDLVDVDFTGCSLMMHYITTPTNAV